MIIERTVLTEEIATTCLTPEFLEEMADQGYAIVKAWQLNEEDYGPGAYNYTFTKDY